MMNCEVERVSMREILFRGKRKDNDEWVKGYPICPEFDKSRAYIGYLFPDDDHDIDVTEVDPSTVGQFTGLTDENGVKIFEGDIIEYTDGCNDWLGAVKYACGDAQFVVRFIGRDVESFDNLYSGDCEVIGNICDNPELFDEGET